MAGESVRVLLECSLWVWDREDDSAPKAWQPRWCSVTKHSNRNNSRIRIRLNRAGPNGPIDSQGHEVPMENYAGLELFNNSFEGKTNCFSLVTFYRTYCLAVSSVDIMKAWVDCIINEIGFEWKFDVRVLATQNIVPPGEATMRFYPRFFSLTSGGQSNVAAPTPPVCLGLWQHNHLRRYGGSQGFSFESGSRSIGGPEVYRLATHQGATIKELFDCVAHGKPLPDPPATMKRTYSISSTFTMGELDTESWSSVPANSAGAAAAAAAGGREYDYVSVAAPRRPPMERESDVNYLSVQVGGAPGGQPGLPSPTSEVSSSSPSTVSLAQASSSTIYSGVDIQKTAQLRDALVQSHRH